MTETAVAKQIVDFLSFSERLKMELRHACASNRRAESVAEHTYQMVLMALLSYSHLSTPVDIGHVLQMILIHDLVEAEVGDVSYIDQMRDPSIKKNKILLEQKAIEKIRNMIASPIGQKIYDLWYEFEANETNEAKFAKALDDLEVQIQHNLAPMDTWEEAELAYPFTKTDRNCKHDSFLMVLANTIIDQAENKMHSAGINVTEIRKKVAA